jgi:hypothetical protein
VLIAIAISGALLQLKVMLLCALCIAWTFMECSNVFHSNIYCIFPDEFDEDVEADPMDEPEATDRSGVFSNL